MKRLFAILFCVTCIAANAQQFAQVGVSFGSNRLATTTSVSVEAGYRFGSVDLSAGLADVTVSTVARDINYVSKTISAVAYKPLHSNLSAFSGIQGATDMRQDLIWRYGLGLVAHDDDVSVSFTVSPTQNSQRGIASISLKTRF